MLQFGKFVATRAMMALFTLVIVSLVVFSLMELVPGDCAERYLAFKNTQGSDHFDSRYRERAHPARP